MIFPEEKRRVVLIRSNKIDYQKKIRQRRRIVLVVSLVVVAVLALVFGIFRVDRPIVAFVTEMKENAAKRAAEKQQQKAEEQAKLAEQEKLKTAENEQGSGDSTDSGETDGTGNAGADSGIEPDGSKDAGTQDGGVAAKTQEKPKPKKKAVKKNEILVAGDVLLSECITGNYDSGGIQNVLSKDLRTRVKQAKAFAINEEFPFSTRGVKGSENDKTFRVDPKYVSILKDMGVDVAGLGNNHVLDYGRDALTDTFTTLDDAGIGYTGAGPSIERSRECIKMTVGGKTIGFLATSHVIPVVGWNIKNAQPGIFTTYDAKQILDDIRAAKESCDYVFVCVHWGREGKETLESYMQTLAHQYVDAGADGVFGAHSHLLQAVEYYKDAPIFYGLGDFIYEDTTQRAALACMTVKKDGGLEASIIPVSAEGGKTSIIEKGEASRGVYDHIQGLAPSNVNISDDGVVTAK